MPFVNADRTRCRGWANCTAEADDVFDVDDDGTVVLLRTAIPESERVRVAEVAYLCPEGALTVTE